ncbi:hypothetical protein AVEN_256906-1 [Araneus ventricosus]|uniref:Uncharacterized protein n=1 Tax=Araneus ventricosus TaxID=182803 RepID=A0A4Y2CG17_ARAVE|nr:hypothetical protein AVEN_256906-1 [Araneus ventricosus]
MHQNLEEDCSAGIGISESEWAAAECPVTGATRAFLSGGCSHHPQTEERPPPASNWCGWINSELLGDMRRGCTTPLACHSPEQLNRDNAGSGHRNLNWINAASHWRVSLFKAEVEIDNKGLRNAWDI